MLLLFEPRWTNLIFPDCSPPKPLSVRTDPFSKVNKWKSISVFCGKVLKCSFCFRTNLELDPELSEDGGELIYRFRGFRGQYKIRTSNENQGKILNEHQEVEQDSEFVIQLNWLKTFLFSLFQGMKIKKNYSVLMSIENINIRHLSHCKFVLLSPEMCVKLFFADLGLCKKIVSENCKATRAEIVKTMARSINAFKYWQQHRLENFLIFLQ